MGDGYPNTIGMGSAAVFWQDDEVHIANFHAYDNGFLMQSSFDGDQGWQATSTGYKVNIANPDTTQLAVSTVIVGAQGKQKIYVFYTKDDDNQIQAAFYDVEAQNWQTDVGFNLVPMYGMPRAAIGWTGDGGDTHIRIFYIQLTSTHDPVIGPNIYYCSLCEIVIENGIFVSGPNVIRTFAQNETQTLRGFSDAIAAVTWANNRQIRLYYYEGDYMVELASSNDDGQWAVSNSWEQHSLETDRFPITATVFSTATSGLQIRVYRQVSVQMSRNKVHEWAWDSSNSKWTDQDLPESIIDNTDGHCQPSVVAWVGPDDNGTQDAVSIRLYQLWGDRSFAGGITYIVESSFDTRSGWTADTAILTPEYANSPP